MSVSADQIAAVMGGPRALGRRVRSMRDLEGLVRAGIPRDGLDAFIARLTSAQPTAEATVRLRNKIVPRATYQRVARFNLQVSETTERLARLYALVLAVFEDRDATARFLMTAHPELEGRTPFDVALTEIGGREVEEIIARGLHGLPA
jgi:putative toxin-antitoxin system antitoxin component (TIGR02293 family)